MIFIEKRTKRSSKNLIIWKWKVYREPGESFGVAVWADKILLEKAVVFDTWNDHIQQIGQAQKHLCAVFMANNVLQCRLFDQQKFDQLVDAALKLHGQHKPLMERVSRPASTAINRDCETVHFQEDFCCPQGYSVIVPTLALMAVKNVAVSRLDAPQVDSTDFGTFDAFYFSRPQEVVDDVSHAVCVRKHRGQFFMLDSARPRHPAPNCPRGVFRLTEDELKALFHKVMASFKTAQEQAIYMVSHLPNAEARGSLDFEKMLADLSFDKYRQSFKLATKLELH